MIICDDTIFLPWTPSFNEITVIFHNASNYHYHFIVNELANKVKSQFECLGKNTKKYKMFSFSIDKEIRKVNKDSNEILEQLLIKQNLSMVQDFGQVHYQIFLIVLKKEFINLNARTAIVFMNAKVSMTI